jgi:uncharacterized repeat protein (TIGR03806 family)
MHPALRAAGLLLLVGCGGGEPFDPAAPRCVHLPRPPSRDVLRLEPAFTRVDVEGGIDLLQSPVDPARWYLVTQPGKILTFTADGAPEVFADLGAQVVAGGESGLLGMAFHPDFADNGEVFLSYNAPGGDVFVSQISRVRSRDGGRTLDLATEESILTVDQPYSNHNGGGVGFGPDGRLYIGLGDGGSAGDPQGNAQNPDVLLGKLLRVDVDAGDPYAIPDDNPFAAGGGAPEIFALGLRNPWRFSFDRETGELWAGDVGQNLWEEVDRVELGGNYGWDIKEGPDCFNRETCDDAALVDPVVAYRNISVASVVAGVVYRGAQHPGLRGRLLYTDFYRGDIFGVRAGEDPVLLASTGVRGLSSFAEDRDGEVYAVGYFGGIYRLVAREPDPGPGLPDMLSGTGCMVAPGEPPDGATPYELVVPFWSDGAEKSRWLVLPDGARVTVGDDGDWELPPGSVAVKHFELAGRRVETRLLVRHDDGGWAGYSYAWDDEGAEATLLAGGLRREVGGQTWIYPDRVECMYCHTAEAGRSLGLETAQLARTVVGDDGVEVDQLDRLVARGVLAARPSGDPYPATDGDAPLADRVRAYLHANCSHCHRPDAPGGRADLDLRFTAPDAGRGLCDAKPRAGDLDIPDARVVAPGDPARSIVSARMHTLGSARMPGVGSARVDDAGVALVDAWIAGLTACP